MELPTVALAGRPWRQEPEAELPVMKSEVIAIYVGYSLSVQLELLTPAVFSVGSWQTFQCFLPLYAGIV